MRINYKHLAIGGLVLGLAMLAMSPSYAAKRKTICPDGGRPYFNVCPGGDEPIPIEEYNGSRSPSDSGAATTTTGTGSKSRHNCSRTPNGEVSADCEPPPHQAFEPEMVDIPAGSFNMGSPQNEPGRNGDEGPVHRVHIKAFAMGKYEVTQRQWREVMGSNPAYFQGCDDCPVGGVSWQDVQEYIQKLNVKSGRHYRLPSEAEWEYACRGGVAGERYCGGNDLDTVAWYSGNSGSKTHPVGQKAANHFGLYDMSGNVWEWNQDTSHNSYAGAPTDGSAWEAGDSNSHMLRGGSWGYKPVNCRAADRNGNDCSYYCSGFRVALSARTL